jgi:hypothetical protein
MSFQDELLNGPTIGYAMDEPTSWQYRTADSQCGAGICNNVCGENFQQVSSSNFGRSYNSAMVRRCDNFAKIGTTNGRSSIFSLDNLKEKNMNYINDTDSTDKLKTYYYNCILRLKDIHDLFDKLPLKVLL